MIQLFLQLTNTWWGILIIILACLLIWLAISALFYKVFFKRFYDIIFSAIALVVLSPIFLAIAIITAIMMKGNPFFIQQRAGKNGKPFNLIKFRSMLNLKDEKGNLLSAELRLTKYGKFLRSTSLDELPQLINIFCGHMSIVGPRPLHVKYNERYNDFQRQRLLIRPGLTGLAQVNGRNQKTWEDKFVLDVNYLNNISFLGDIKIIFKTIIKVLKREGISQGDNAYTPEFMGTKENERKEEDEKS